MIDLAQLRFVPLDLSQPVSDFVCGNPDLDEFLKQDALVYQNGKLASTYLCFHGSELVAYVALTMDCVRLDEDEKVMFLENKARLHEFPSGKIARLAVKKSWQNKGLGSFLLKVSIGKLWKLGESIGCRFATVDAKPDALGFYERHAFIRNLHRTEKSRHTVSMRYDLLHYAP